MPSSLRLGFVVAGLALLAGCPACFPGKVGPGAARLTIRNVGAMATMLNADTSCGFGSMAVLSAPTVSGNVGGMGTVTFTATDCVIDSGEGKEVSKGCTDIVTTASGKITLSATRTIEGQLTGNPMNPVIPKGPDAVTITITKATFDNFKVVSSASESKLTLIKGNLTAVVKPQLAVNKTNGACSVATPNTNFANVKYDTGSEAFVDSPGNAFGVTIDGSNLEATNGKIGDETNHLHGLITVFGKEVESEPVDGLDPEYNQEKFDMSWQCNPELATPISFTCADLKPRLAGGVARLTARTLGVVTSMIDKNTMCGFSSPAVAGMPTSFTGTVGRPDGVATFTIATPCTIMLPADTMLPPPDCNMVTTSAGGQVTVTGTKRVSGWRTGNARQPIVPTTPEPALFDLSLVFTNFEIKKSDSTSSLLIKSGGLTGKVAPRTAIDTGTGACSISTPVVTFSDMSWNANTAVQITSDGNKFDLTVGASMLNAQNGTKGTGATLVSNTISGTITVDTMPYPLAAMGEPLDTAFVQATFDASFACTPRIFIPPVDAACNFRQALGTGAARLLAKNFATATSLTDNSSTCGFRSPAVVGGATQIGDAGTPGAVVFTVNGCVTMLPANTPIATNCLGAPTRAGGSVTVSGTKTVLGLRTPTPPFIVPLARDAGTFDLTSVNFAAFDLYDLPNDGGTTPSSRSSLTGMGSVVVRPVGGQTDAGATPFPVYSTTTPIAGIDNLTMASGTMTLISDGNQFDVTLTSVSLNAYNGSQYGRSNVISGSLTVDGQPVMIAPGTPLDPAFNQARFDSTYACTPGLVSVVPP